MNKKNLFSKLNDSVMDIFTADKKWDAQKLRKGFFLLTNAVYFDEQLSAAHS